MISSLARVLSLIIAMLAAGCTIFEAPSSAPGAPSLGFSSRIKVPEGNEVALRLRAKGVQIFRCEAADGEFLWSFRQPEAELLDDGGQLVARHGAGFSFEHRDGSRLVAKIVAHDEASRGTDLRWLLLSARSFGNGAFSGTTYVQRVNTAGGMPPPTCQANERNHPLRVDFSADFIFYKARR